FIEQIADEDERACGWQRYRDITSFASSKQCRHQRICAHFGESVKWEKCGACDICSSAAAEVPSIPVTTPASRHDSRAKKRNRTAVRAGQRVEPDPALLKALKDWRLMRARANGVPAFVIFHDSVLAEISATKPRTLEALNGIKGIGENKLARYGEEMLR